MQNWYKISEFERMFPEQSPMKKPSQEIVDFVNQTCQNDKNCEKFYFKQMQRLNAMNSLSLENIRQIKYETKSLEIPEHLKTIIEQIKIIDGSFVDWSLKQLQHIKPEDYKKLLEDLKSYKGLKINNKEFKTHDINSLKDENELYRLLEPFKAKTTQTTNANWKGKWIYEDEKVRIFESNDPQTISHISGSNNTRWCIKNPEIAKNTYYCEQYPMQFVFLDNKLVAVIHINSQQIKNVDDFALNDYSIIKQIDPILRKLNLVISGGDSDDDYAGDFDAYNDVLQNGQKINNELEQSNNRLEYIKNLQDDQLIYIDKKYILYDKAVRQLFINRIQQIYNFGQPMPSLDSELVQSIKELYEIFIQYWLNKIDKNISSHYMCPGYLAKNIRIQNSYKNNLIKTLREFDSKEESDKIYCIEELRKHPELIPTQLTHLFSLKKKLTYKRIFNDNIMYYFQDPSYAKDPDIKNVALSIAIKQAADILSQDVKLFIALNQHFNGELAKIDSAIKASEEEALNLLSNGDRELFYKLDEEFDRQLSVNPDIFKKLNQNARSFAINYLSHGYIDKFKKIDDSFNNKFSKDKEFMDAARNKAIENILNSTSDLIGDYDENKITYKIDNAFNNELLSDPKIIKMIEYKLKMSAMDFLSTGYKDYFDNIDKFFNYQLSKDSTFMKETREMAIKQAVHLLDSIDLERFAELNTIFNNTLIESKILIQKAYDIFDSCNLDSLEKLYKIFKDKFINEYQIMTKVEKKATDFLNRNLYKKFIKLYQIIPFDLLNNKYLITAVKKMSIKFKLFSENNEIHQFKILNKMFNNILSDDQEIIDEAIKLSLNVIYYDNMDIFYELYEIFGDKLLDNPDIMSKLIRKATYFIHHFYMNDFNKLDKNLDYKLSKNETIIKAIQSQSIDSAVEVAIHHLRHDNLEYLDELNDLFDKTLLYHPEVLKKSKELAIYYIDNNYMNTFNKLNDLYKGKLLEDLRKSEDPQIQKLLTRIPKQKMAFNNWYKMAKYITEAKLIPNTPPEKENYLER